MAAAEVTDANFREVVVESPGACACGQCAIATYLRFARVNAVTKMAAQNSSTFASGCAVFMRIAALHN